MWKKIVKTINVKLENHSYPIIVGKGVFTRLIGLIESRKLHRTLFAIKGKRYQKKQETIRNWIEEDKLKQDKQQENY